jgi:very-short-patch-repair endonuclease
MTDCKFCDSFTANKTFCCKTCSLRHLSAIRKNQFGTNNPNYKTGKRIRILATCTFCGRETYRNGPSKNVFCNKTCNSEWQKGGFIGKNNPAYGLKRPDLVLYNKTREFTEETKNKIRQYTISQYKRGDFKKKDTLPERLVEEQLKKLGIFYIKQAPYELGIVDFYLPGHNIIIFVDGNYWHNYPVGNQKDLRQDLFLTKFGYDVHRIWESDIYKDVVGCLKSIR